MHLESVGLWMVGFGHLVSFRASVVGVPFGGLVAGED